MKGTVYGYVRSSQNSQNADRQMIALWDFGVAPENVFLEQEAVDGFPAYQQAVNALKADDTLVIASIDVLGNDCYELMDRWRQITIDKKAGIIVLDLPLANTGIEEEALGKIVARITLGVMQHFDQSRQYKKQKQAEGIAEARRKGVRFGRKPREIPQEFESVRLRWDRGEISARRAADSLGVETNTFLKWVRTDVHSKQEKDMEAAL